MSFIIHSLNPNKTVNWTSGTSTELYIHPSESNFHKRDFIFRISTATVETEESTFSDFTGLTRILMVLRGKIRINHEERYEVTLNPFDQDTFNGSWKTRSYGCGQDFNVIFNETCIAKISHRLCSSGQSIQPDISGKWSFIFVFDGIFRCNKKQVVSNDLIEFNSDQQELLECMHAGNCIEIVISEKSL